VKLAIIRQRYNPFGGAERFVERALGALAAERVELTIVARQWNAGTRDASFLRCDPFYMGRTWRDASFARAVCAALDRERFDLVQSHERIACCDIYRAGDGVHAKWLENRGRAIQPWRRILARLNPYHRYVLNAERKLFASPKLRAVICNSRMVRDEIRARFGIPVEKLHVIYSGIDLDAFHPGLRAHRAALRSRLGIADSAPVVLFVGSGFERKGLGALLEAFAALGSDAHLLVVGADAGLKRYETLASRLGIEPRVHFAGGQNDVKPWYGAADVFALPTLYDPFPNAALEALACGLPVVTSASCGAAELIRDGGNGFVCRDALDVDSLGEALRQTVAHAGAWSAAARAAAEPFGMARMAQALTTLYRHLMEPARA
jgi:UDP-glucose:(heptosyl)LPS alpha-1,3-glucosyltransferase